MSCGKCGSMKPKLKVKSKKKAKSIVSKFYGRQRIGLGDKGSPRFGQNAIKRGGWG